MMEAKDKWVLDRASMEPHEILGIRTADGRPVLHPTNTGDLAVSEEDARKIVAAPELLEGIREAIAWIYDHRYGTGAEMILARLRVLRDEATAP